MVYRTALLSMILNNLTWLLRSRHSLTLNISNGYRYGHSYYRRRIGNRTQAFEWHQFQLGIPCRPNPAATLLVDIHTYITAKMYTCDRASAIDSANKFSLMHNCQVTETVAVLLASSRDEAAGKLTAELMGHTSTFMRFAIVVVAAHLKRWRLTPRKTN